MRHLGSVLLLVLLAASGVFAQNHPVPFLDVPLSPTTVLPGGGAFTLTVHGAQFVSGATVHWNGQALATTFVNGDELTATVPATDIVAATSAAITVTNPTPGGGTSNVVYLQVSLPTDLQFSTSPSSTSLPKFYGITTAIAADLTQNGNLDLAFSSGQPSAEFNYYGWSVLGNGDGSFQPPLQAIPQTLYGVVGAAPVIGDFNGDGIPDLVATNCFTIPLPGTCNLSVFLGNGDGTFTEKAEYTVEGSTPVVGDFNGDGQLDVALATFSSTASGITVFFGNGDGTLQSGVTTAVTNMGNLYAAGDFDGDGKLDLIGTTTTGTTNAQLEITFFHGNGDGTFSPSSTTYSIAQNSLQQMLAADLNGDGKLDLVTLQLEYPQSSEEAVFSFTSMLGNGNGTFQTPVSYALGTSATPLNIVLGDFGATGKLDVAYPNGTNTIILPGKGDGTFDTTNSVTVPAPAQLLVAGDFNNDGKLDLASCDNQNAIDTISYLLQDVPVAGFSPSSLTFAAEPLGSTSPAEMVTLTNNGTASLSFSSAQITGTNAGDFAQTNDCPATMAVGASCQINVRFTPGANGARGASLAVTDDAPGSPQTVMLSGSGGLAAVQLSPPSIDFANEAVGNTSPAETITVTNAGYSTTNISSIGVTGANASDFSETNNCGATLAAGANCSISVTFTPAAMGSRSAAVTIVDDAPGSPQTIALTGNGSGIVGLSPSSITFSSQYVGTTGLPQSVTVTNNAATPLTISKVATSPSDFASLNACSSTLPPGASCAIGVFFDPTQAGSRAGTLTITDSATGSPQTVSLNGTGQDFSMAPSSSTATVSPGQTANYTVAITPGGGFHQKVSFSCAGAPALATCAVTPNSLALSGSASSSVSVAVSTAANSRIFPQWRGFRPIGGIRTVWLAVAGIVLLRFGVALAYGRKRRLQCIRPLAFACLLLVVTILASCAGGGGGNHGGAGTPAGTYTLTVTGTFTSGTTTLTHNTPLTLVVQ